MRTRDLLFEPEDAPRRGVRVRHAGQPEHRRNVRPVARPDRIHGRRRLDVVVAVGHAEAALQDVRRVARRIVEVERNPEAEKVVGLKVRRVQRIDVAAQAAADLLCQRRAIADRGDPGHERLERLRPLRLDRLFVHVSGEVVGYLLLVRPWRGAAAGPFDQLARAPLGLFREQRPRPVGAAIGRNLRLGEPRAVREAEEVVTRRNRAVDAREIDGVRRCRRRRGRRRRLVAAAAGGGGHRNQDGSSQDSHWDISSPRADGRGSDAILR